MSGKSNRSKHKWSMDFSSRNRNDRQIETIAQLPMPCGYTDKQLSEKGNSSDTNKPDLVVKKSWDIALGPLKQVPMNLFIMWMAGNSISIFPIMMVGMMFVRPFQALFAVNQTFIMIEGGQSHLQKFVYIIGNLASLGLAVYKCQVMGLLPTHASDWLAFVEPQQRVEWTGGGMSL